MGTYTEAREPTSSLLPSSCGQNERIFRGNFGLIRLTRIAQHRKQSDVAQALGISRERISQLETGRSIPGPNLLDRLAEALDSSDLRELATARRAK
jgi:DNA-binding XRE family transcriptional regulator